jgi:hypothetical protein
VAHDGFPEWVCNAAIVGFPVWFLLMVHLSFV